VAFSHFVKKKQTFGLARTEPGEPKPVAVQKNGLGSVCLFHGPSCEKLGLSQKLGPYGQPYIQLPILIKNPQIHN
jgi:hypothetical protein